MYSFLQKNWFVIGLFGVTGLALWQPQLGLKGGILQSEWTTQAAVFMIFLSQGLSLPTEDLARGLVRWRLHLGIQLTLFGCSTCFALLLMHVWGSAFDESVRLGFLFLGILPTTVSTALVFVGRAGGRTTETLFNITVSNLLAIFIVPGWMFYVASSQLSEVETLPVFMKILGLILLPLVIGQCIRPRVHSWVDARRKTLGNLNSALVLFIVFCSFCASLESGLLETQSPRTLMGIAGLVMLLYCLLQVTVAVGARLLKLEREDFICVFFTCTLKSVAVGVPMAGSLFSDFPEMLGGVLLPLLIYSFLQLSLGALWVARFAQVFKIEPLN